MIVNPKRRTPMNRVCFDLETEPISGHFCKAKSKRDRILNARPKLCPECGIETLAASETDPAEMTEGQQTDHGAGLWGVAHCNERGAVLDWYA